VEQEIGNINNIIVEFYNDILTNMGFNSVELQGLITNYIGIVIPSCSYQMASLSQCSIYNITILSDQEIYLFSQTFGQSLLALPCP
jgi:hypothetical protein